MNAFKRVIFIVWIVVIAVLSIIPHANENGGISFKLTESGMVLHFGAYFSESALFFWIFKKNTLFSVLISSFSVFMFGVVLEFVQFYLPYRTFNPIDIAANGLGIGAFCLIYLVKTNYRMKPLTGRMPR